MLGVLGVQLGVLGTDEGRSTDLFGPSVLGVLTRVEALTCLDPVCWVYSWVYWVLTRVEALTCLDPVHWVYSWVYWVLTRVEA